MDRKKQPLLGFLETCGDSLCVVYNLLKAITKQPKKKNKGEKGL